MRKLILIPITVLFFLTNCCQSNSNYTIKNLLTNKSSKYWIINSINDRNVETAKTRIIWKFDINGKYTDYRLEDGNLNLSDNGDELYSNSYEVLSENKVKLNGYEYKLVKLTKDSLMVTNDYYAYILLNYNR